MAVGGYGNSGKGIVTDGLIFSVDAYNTKSYVSGSSTTYTLTKDNINGTLTNGVGFNDKYWSLDGTNDYIDFADNHNFEYNIPFSCDSWVYVNSSESGIQIPFISKREVGPNFRGWDFQKIGTDSLTVTITNVNLTNQISVNTIGSYTIEFDKWLHIGFSYDGSTNANGVKFYVNGEQKTTNIFTNNLSATISTSETLQIGKSGGISDTMGGDISAVKIYDKILTPAEVLQNYNALKWRFI